MKLLGRLFRRKSEPAVAIATEPDDLPIKAGAFIVAVSNQLGVEIGQAVGSALELLGVSDVNARLGYIDCGVALGLVLPPMGAVRNPATMPLREVTLAHEAHRLRLSLREACAHPMLRDWTGVDLAGQLAVFIGSGATWASDARGSPISGALELANANGELSAVARLTFEAGPAASPIQMCAALQFGPARPLPLPEPEVDSELVRFDISVFQRIGALARDFSDHAAPGSACRELAADFIEATSAAVLH